MHIAVYGVVIGSYETEHSVGICGGNYDVFDSAFHAARFAREQEFIRSARAFHIKESDVSYRCGVLYRTEQTAHLGVSAACNGQVGYNVAAAVEYSLETVIVVGVGIIDVTGGITEHVYGVRSRSGRVEVLTYDIVTVERGRVNAREVFHAVDYLGDDGNFDAVNGFGGVSVENVIAVRHGLDVVVGKDEFVVFAVGGVFERSAVILDCGNVGCVSRGDGVVFVGSKLEVGGVSRAHIVQSPIGSGSRLVFGVVPYRFGGDSFAVYEPRAFIKSGLGVGGNGGKSAYSRVVRYV